MSQVEREIVIQKIVNGYLVRSPAPYAYKTIAEVTDAIKRILEGREKDSKAEKQ